MGSGNTTTLHWNQRLVIIATALALIASQTVGFAFGSHGSTTIGADDFEIDGNPDQGSGVDWDGHAWELVADAVSSSSDDVFEPSTKEEPSPPPCGGSSKGWPCWKVQTGNANDKGDLHRWWVHSQIAGPSASFLWLAASRVSSNGNAEVTFEFNKDFTPLPTLSTTATSWAPSRATGDLRITFNFPGNSGIQADPKVERWVAGAWTLVSSDAGRAASGMLGGTRDFVEAEIDLGMLIQGGLPCGQFGMVSARTQTSSGNTTNGNPNQTTDPTLKDLVAPTQVNLNTCGGITAEKVDPDGQPLSGATFSLTGPGITTPRTCQTDSTGTCGWADLLPTTGTDVYTVTETVAPAGYAIPTPAFKTTTLAALAQVKLTFEDPRIPYAIDVTPEDETNPVGAPHTFTVTLTKGAPGDAPVDGKLSTPVVGATVDLAWTGPGTVDATCTTDANGRCTIQLHPDQAGSGTLTATYTTPYQHVTSTGGSWTDTDKTISDSGDKTWRGWIVDVDPDTATNLVDNDHTFTITVVEDDGASTPADDVKVTATWSGDANERTCTTDATGTCQIKITAPSTPTAGTLTVISVEGKLSSNANVVGKQTSFGTDSDVDADKEWWDLEVVVTGDGVNPLDHDHDFKASATYLTPSGRAPAVGIELEADWTTATDSVLTSDNPCVTDANGDCTFSVSGASAVGTGTLTIVRAGELSTDPSFTTTFADSSDLSGQKGWADYRLRLTPETATNDISDPVHVFTATVEAANNGGTWKPIKDVLVTASWDQGTAAGSALTSSPTCTTGNDGSCTFTVTSPEGGTGTLTATATIAGPTTNDPDLDVEDTATKRWVQHRVLVSEDGHNWVGDPHVFEAQVQRSFDDGATWVNEHNVEIDVGWGGPTGHLAEATDCGGEPTPGPCRIRVESDLPGLGELEIDWIAVLVDGEYVTIEGEDLVIVQANGDTTPEITKTWHAFRVLRDVDAFNPVGQDHTFTLEVQYSASNDGDDPIWTDAPDGTQLLLEWTGVGSIVEASSTCLTSGTVDGGCTVVVTGEDQTGTGTLTVTGVVNPIRDLIADLTFDITGVTMSKTWGDRFVTIRPATATTQVGQTHTYVARLFDRSIVGTGEDAVITDTPLPFEELDLTLLEGPGHMTRVIGARLFDEASEFQLSALFHGTIFDENGGWIDAEDPTIGACVTAGNDHPTLDVGECLIDTQSPAIGTDTLEARHEFGGVQPIPNTLLTFSNHTPFAVWAIATNVWFQPSSPPPPPPPPPSTPAVDLVKTGSTTTAEVGDTVSYTYRVTNTGSTTLDVVLSDAITVGGATVTVDLITAADGVTLAAGASTTRTFRYQVSSTDLPGPILNVATVTGTAPDGTRVSASDDWAVDLIEVLGEVITRPSIEVVKEALVPVDPDTGTKIVTYEEGTGDVIEYRYTITNTGDVTLTNLTAVDDVLGDLFPAATTLAPGESTTATATHVLTEADAVFGSVKNVVIVTATDPDGEDVSDTDTETVEVIEVLPLIEERPPAPAPAPEPLPRTGVDATVLFTWAMLMTALGAALIITPGTLGAVRRRREGGGAS